MKAPLSVLAVALLAGRIAAQDSQPAPTLAPPAQAPAQAPAPAAAPATTQPASRPVERVLEPAALLHYERMCTALDGGKPGPAVRGMRLELEIIKRGAGQTNEDNATTFSWLEPEHVRLRMSSGREEGRGPSGYWFRDRPTDAFDPLKGRESAEDRRQIDELAALGKNFSALCRPREWNLERLVLRQEAPANLPVGLHESARALDWIELSSASFRLIDADQAGVASGPKIYEVCVGLERAGESRGDAKPVPGLPRLLTICEKRDGIIVLGSAVCIYASRYKPVDGVLVPHSLLVRRPNLHSQPWSFEDQSSLDLWLKQASLNPRLAPADFEPVAK